MVRRLFWFTVGAGVTVFVVIKVRDYMHKASPEAIGSRMKESASGVGETLRDFSVRVREAMGEREAELRDAIGMPEPQPE